VEDEGGGDEGAATTPTTDWESSTLGCCTLSSTGLSVLGSAISGTAAAASRTGAAPPAVSATSPFDAADASAGTRGGAELAAALPKLLVLPPSFAEDL
jgi:hypothetical protein